MQLMQRWRIAGNAGKALRENANYELICASAGWQIENCAHLLHYSQTDFFLVMPHSNSREIAFDFVSDKVCCYMQKRERVEEREKGGGREKEKEKKEEGKLQAVKETDSILIVAFI